MNLDIWEELKGKDELAYCKKCGKKIWAFWHTDSNLVSGRMEKCGPCFFDKKK